MPRYTLTATFDLVTEIEPEFDPSSFEPGLDDYDNYEDSSYFSAERVVCSGGDVKFDIEAEDEYAAKGIGEQSYFEGQEFEDRNGLTWVYENVDIQVDEVEEPLTRQKAEATVWNWLAAHPEIPADVKEAMHFLLGLISQ